MHLHTEALETRFKDNNNSTKLVVRQQIINIYLEIMHTYTQKKRELHELKFPITHYNAKSFLILWTVEMPFPVSVAIVLIL